MFHKEHCIVDNLLSNVSFTCIIIYTGTSTSLGQLNLQIQCMVERIIIYLLRSILERMMIFIHA